MDSINTIIQLGTKIYTVLSVFSSLPRLYCCTQIVLNFKRLNVSHLSLCTSFLRSSRCWPSGKGVRLESGRFGVRFPLGLWGFLRVESYQSLRNRHFSGYPPRCIVLWGQRWNCLARCQYTVIGWGRKFDPELLSQCGNMLNCLSRSISEI